MSLQNQSNITNFRIDIPDQHTTEQFLLNVQTASIPGMRLSVTEMPLNAQGTARAQVPGSTTEFDPLIVTVLMDENLEAWIQIYRWMLSLNDYARQNSTMWKNVEQPKALQLHVLNNTKTDIVATFNYFNAWPSELSEIEYTYTDEGDVAVTFTVTFNYSYFEVERNGAVIRPRSE